MRIKWTKYPLIIFISTLIGSSFGFAQNIRFGQISVEDGLSNSSVNCLIQDRLGFLWFGTDDGLNRFDGYEVKIFRNNPSDTTSLSENTIWALFEDRSGYLWIGTRRGDLNKYDPFTDKFQSWNLKSDGKSEIGISYIYEDKLGFIWVGTYKHGLFKFEPSMNKFEHWYNQSNLPNTLSNNFITSILEDESGIIWIATYSGLNKYNPGNLENPFTQVEILPGHPETILNNRIWFLSNSKLKTNTIWIGTLGGLIQFEPHKNNYSKINLPESDDLQFGNSISSISEALVNGEEILWAGTFGGSVRINLTNGSRQRFSKSKDSQSGILSNQVNDLIIDRSGVVWMATDNGLSFFSPKSSKFNSSSIQPNTNKDLSFVLKKNIRAITHSADGSLWLGSDEGLFNINNYGLNKHLHRNIELQSLNIWSLSSNSSNNLWIGTYGQGLKELNLKTYQLKSWNVKNPDFNSSPYFYVKSLLQDEKGMLWIGFWGGGLARLNPLTKQIDHWRHEADDTKSLGHNDVWTIYQDNNNRIWIGTNGGGLNLLNVETTGFTNWMVNKNNPVSLSSNNIYSICEAAKGSFLKDETVLWIGTGNGLNKFMIKNDTAQDSKNFSVDIQYFTVDNGLPDNAVESILEDENGNLWIGTSSGITHFNTEKEVFTNFSIADGLNGNKFNSSSALKAERGLYFFGSTTGLNFFYPEQIIKSSYSPPVLITDFKILNHSVKIGNDSPLKTSIFYTKEITLDYNQDVFSFQFASLDYNSTRSIQYAYRMDDFDKDWIYSGSRRFVTYTNLDPGEYIFRVKATNADGVWNKTETILSIIINPPIWATWWAYSIYMLLFISVLVSIRSFELNRRRKKEEERLRREREEFLLREANLKAITIEKEKELEKQKIRNRIAQDLHDEIGSNLSSISLMSDLVQKAEKVDFESIEKIKRIHKVAKDSSQAMRDIVWITNSTSDNLKDLITKMNEVANDMLGTIKWSFEFPKDYPENNLTPETKRNVFFIYKEALNNIIKHSGATNVFIKLKIRDKSLLLAIKDNGRGFSPGTGFSGNGLKNMENRAKEIHGILKLKSSPGKGTTLALAVNITQVRD